jgi:hypothetical protein
MVLNERVVLASYPSQSTPGVLRKGYLTMSLYYFEHHIIIGNRMSQKPAKTKKDYLDLNMSVYEKGVLPRVRIFTLQG